MKTVLFLFIVTLIFFGCEKEKSPEEQAEFNREVSNLLKSTLKEVYLDTTGIANSPIKVISSKIIKEDYSNYRNIRLTYKNVSKKTVEAIRFQWYVENAFGELADEGKGYGFTEERLKPNRTNSSVWKMLSRDAKKIIMARAYEIVFTDGTKWKQKND